MTTTKIAKTNVRIDSWRYAANLGHQPKGFGNWAFHPDFNVDALDNSIFWITANYSDAKKAAKAHFASLGISYVQVLS